LLIHGIGKLKNDAVTLFTAKSTHFKQTQDEKTQGHYVGTLLFYPAFVFEQALSTRQCRETDPVVTLNHKTRLNAFVRVIPAACKRKISAQSAIRSLRKQG
jgi:hypothetical protein